LDRDFIAADIGDIFRRGKKGEIAVRRGQRDSGAGKLLAGWGE
jgi:hypothetical protein